MRGSGRANTSASRWPARRRRLLRKAAADEAGGAHRSFARRAGAGTGRRDRVHPAGELTAGALGRRSGRPDLGRLAARRLRFGVRLERNLDAGDAVDPDRAGRHRRFQGAPVQHRRRGPALWRRAGGGRGRRPAWRHRLRSAAGAAVRADDDRCCIGRRAAAAGTGRAQSQAWRR